MNWFSLVLIVAAYCQAGRRVLRGTFCRFFDGQPDEISRYTAATALFLAPVDPILHRQLASLTYVEPESLLRDIMPLVVAILQKPETVTHLTPRQKKAYLEQHQAAFLTYVWKRIAGPLAEVTVCVMEALDFDCVMKGVMASGETVYKPVQLKQLPSYEVNPKADLQTTIDRLKKQYATSADLVVGIWINRDVKVDFARLDFSGLRIEQLWLFGDSVSGPITLDGGVVADLISGVRWSGVMVGGVPTVRQFRFKPIPA